MLMVLAPSLMTASSTRQRKSVWWSGCRPRAELDVVTVLAREAHRQRRLFEHLLGRHASFFPCGARLVAMKM